MIRKDNDQRYALRTAFVDESGEVIRGDTITVSSVPAHVQAITTTQISNWDEAHGWGDHALAGYLTSFTETDPTVPSHVKSITTTQVSNWDDAFSWGNHASVGYLTSFTETDPTVPTHVKSITTTQVSNWDDAFSWGDHAGLYAAASHTHSYIPLSGSDSVTGGISTTGTYIEAGKGTGSVALTTNDGQGNANLTFNHRNAIPDIAGNVGRIEVNVDSTSSARMYFEVRDNADTLSVVTNNYGMALSSDTLTINNSGSAGGGTLEAGTGDFSSSVTALNLTATSTVNGGTISGNTVTSYGTVTASGGDSTQWNEAYSWGDHAAAGYITSQAAAQTLSFSSSTGSLSISDGNTVDLDGRYLEGSGGVLTGVLQIASSTYNDHLQFVRSTEQWNVTPSTDGSLDFSRPAGTGTARVDFPSITVGGSTVDSTAVGNWNTAYGWGDHELEGYMKRAATTFSSELRVLHDGGAVAAYSDPDFTFDAATSTVKSVNANFSGTATTLNLTATSAVNAGTVSANSITSYGTVTASGGTSTNWNTAFGWGNHAGLYPTLTGTGASGTWGISITGNAGSVDGYSATTAATASTVAVRDGSADIACRLLRPNFANQATINGAMAFRVNNSTDNYVRFCSDKAAIRTFLDVPTRTGGNASGSWGINVTGSSASCTGNAATATTASSANAVAVNAATATWYDILGHSGGTVYSDTACHIHGSGYIQASYFNTTHGVATRNSDTVFYSSTDDYIRKNNSAGMKSSLGFYTSGDSPSFGAVRATKNGAVDATWDTAMAFQASGSYGGGLALITPGGSSEGYGIYTTSGGTVLKFAQGSATASLSSQLTLSSGNLTATGNITAYSDERLKSDVETLDGSKVYEMRGVSFTKDGEKGSGVIAQELQKVAPELVQENDEYLSVAYGNLVGYLIEAVKDLKAEIEELKNDSSN